MRQLEPATVQLCSNDLIAGANVSRPIAVELPTEHGSCVSGIVSGTAPIINHSDPNTAES